MKMTEIEHDENLLSLTRTLRQMHEGEIIPAPMRRAAIRAQLIERLREMKLSIFETQIGWIGVAFSERGLAAIQLPRTSRAQTLAELVRDYPTGAFVEQAPAEIVRELHEYVEGRRREFDLPLDWSTVKPFQRAVMSVLSQIPFGETRSYAWVARQIGKPNAARAVGRAVGANPIPIIIPCHRVIGSDGSLTGYGGGLPLKKRLLQLEGAMLF
jgi:methylated-DNA-[protein]-cysteine S-methyltransferase